jgi:hypothetical protein
MLEVTNRQVGPVAATLLDWVDEERHIVLTVAIQFTK